MIDTLRPSASAPERPHASWLALTGVAAALVTTLDAALLERKHGFFNGGFLAVDHLAGLGDTLAFLAASLLADAAVAGALAGVGLWALSRGWLRPRAAWLVALALAVLPLWAATLLSYRVAAYLGDSLNIALLFELTGRNASEFLAVAFAHLLGPVVTLGAAGAAGGYLMWVVYGRSSHAPRHPRPASTLAAPLLLFVLGIGLTGLFRQESRVLDNGLRRKASAQVMGWLASPVTDVDGDGYGLFSYPSDPAPLEAAIFPYAIDVPGNGIDENGVGGDLPPGPEYVESRGGTPAWRSTPDLVLIVLESFRADMIGATHRGAAVTPVMNGLAAAGVAVPYLYSHNGYTSQSRHHIFSGSLAGIREGTLIDDFKSNGYEVAYFSGQDESFGGARFDVGFERADVAYDARVEPDRRYSTFATAGSLAVPYTVVLERIRAFLSARTSRQPLFLYVNFHDTHFPYHHPGISPILAAPVVPQKEIAPLRAQDVRAMYANTVANVDRAVGAVLDMVRSAGPAEPAVIVTADHGESLFDDGVLGHGVGMTDTQTRIPLIAVNLPATLPSRMGQAEIRDVIGSALTHPTTARQPVLENDPDAAVFQYLGNMDDPAQIALARSTGRTVFDFRMGLVQSEGSAAWRRPEALNGADTLAFEQLVHTWERIVLARNRNGAGAR